MAEQRLHVDHVPDLPDLDPFNDDQTAIPSSNATRYDIDAGDHGLPAADFNIGHPRPPQERMTFEQYRHAVDARTAQRSSRISQLSASQPALNTGPTRQSPGRVQQSRAQVSQDPTAKTPSNDLRISKSRRTYHQAPPQMRTRNSEIAEDVQSPSHGSPTQPAGASTGEHSPSSEHPTSESNGLRFESFEDATAMRERLLRRPMRPMPNDDVEEVEENKHVHVLSIVEALKYKGFLPLPPPETKKPKKKAPEPTEDEIAAKRVKFQNWQKDSQEVVEVHLSQPHADEVFEICAWEVFDEIIKIHHEGFRLTNQTKNLTLICSARIEQAVQVIKDYSRVRCRLLERQKIPDFGISPFHFAKKTHDSHKNNSGRPRKGDGDAVSSKKKATRRIPKTNGSVARRYPAVPDGADKKKKKSAKTKRNDAAKSESSVERESRSVVSNDSRDNRSLPGSGEEEGVDEDAEWGDDDVAGHEDAISRHSLHDAGDDDIGEGLFGHVPNDVPQHRSSYLNDTHPAHLGKTSLSTPGALPPTQASAYGSQLPGPLDFTAQSYSAPMTSSAMFPSSGFGNMTTMGTGYPQQMNYPSYGHPSGMIATANYLPTFFNRTTNILSSSLRSAQDPQSDMPKTRTSKRRKL